MSDTTELPVYVLVDTAKGKGRILVLQSAECMTCQYTDLVYLDMSIVDEQSNVVGTQCPVCASSTIRMTTYDKVD